MSKGIQSHLLLRMLEKSEEEQFAHLCNPQYPEDLRAQKKAGER
jgi:hypothetical protein